MGVWLTLFLFPGENSALKGELALPVFKNHGIKLNDPMPLELMEDGFLLARLSETYSHENESTEETVERILKNDINCEVGFGDQQVYGSCGFHIAPPRPNWNSHIVIAWPKKTYYEVVLENDLKTKYRNLLKEFAKAVKAPYLVFSEEAAENFTNCFEEIDGTRYFDAALLMKNPWPMRVYEVWVDHKNGGKKPIGFPLHKGIDIGNGFVKYHANYSAMNQPYYCAICGYDTII